MLRRLLDSPWFYFGLAAVLVVVALASLVEVRVPERPRGDRESLLALRDRDDVNVVFILIDTLRADHLGSYGYERPTTPIMDEMAQTGIRFARVESQSSWTKTSMASLWTGLYPQRNGILRFNHAVPDEATMPAEVFQQAGYATGGVWRNGWVADNFGFNQGFDLYFRPTPSRDPRRFERRNPSTGPLQGTDWDATQSAIEFVRTHPDQRFFLYVHYMDVHQYLYDEESTLFGTRYVDAYDNALHWTDRNVGYLLGALDDMDLLKKTLVVIASDHGEAFGEHGVEGHARNLYREVTETPLLLSPPIRFDEPVVVEERVQNVDIWPTVLDMLGLPPLPVTDGRSLMPLVLGELPAELQDRTSFAELDRHWGWANKEPNPIVAVVKGDHRLVVHTKLPKKSVELYDHRNDPGEERNIAKHDPEARDALMAEVRRYREMTLPWAAPEVEIDEMRLEQLRALGYVVKTK